MEKIKFELICDGSVARIILDDGKGNVLDSVMMDELSSLLISFFEMKDIKALVFVGAGKHFSFGASVEEHRAESADQMLSSFHNLFYLLADLAIPSIATRACRSHPGRHIDPSCKKQRAIHKNQSK